MSSKGFRRPVDPERRKAAQNGETISKLPTGAVRGTDIDSEERYDLISPIGLRRLAQTHAEGSVKYGDTNYLKGIDSRNLINHMKKHIRMWEEGDNSEDHLGHAAWNLFTLMHFEETRPELIDRPYAPGFNPDTDPTNLKIR